jgi:hypothetical protein
MLQPDHWYHLAGVYDGTYVKIYQDGVLKAFTAASGTIFGTLGAPPLPPSGICGNYPPLGIHPDSLCIGGVVGAKFEGLLDESRIYNRALTDEEIEEQAQWGARVVNLYRVGENWIDDDLRGELQPSAAEQVGFATVTQENIPGWFDWSMTKLVQQWVDEVYENHGVVLRVAVDSDGDPGPVGIVWFHSSEEDDPLDDYRPRLIVRYRVGGRPNLESIAMLESDNTHAGADDGWAVGAGGVIVHYGLENGTWGWRPWDNGSEVVPEVGLRSVSMRNNSEGWIVGDGGTLLHFTGGFWVDETDTSLTVANLAAVSVASNGEAIAVGSDGTILAYDGTNWSLDPDNTLPATIDLAAIKAFSRAKYWGAGQEGTVVRKLGGEWKATTDPSRQTGTTNNLRGIDILPMQTMVTDWRESLPSP